MPPKTQQSNSLRYRFLTRLPLELRTRIYELVVIETKAITLTSVVNGMIPPPHYGGPLNLFPHNFRNTRKTRTIFPALILDLGRSLTPIILEAREVFFRKNLFQVHQNHVKYFVASMRQLGVAHWIQNVEFIPQKQSNLPEDHPWELAYFELLSFPLTRLEVNSEVFCQAMRSHGLQDYENATDAS